MASGLFERARNIRLKGENWQNAIQRAKAQITYETQIRGGAKPHRKRLIKTLDDPNVCTVNPASGRCGRNHKDGEAPELCSNRRKSSGRRTCYRKDSPRDPNYPMKTNRNPSISLYRKGHRPWNKGKKTGPRHGTRYADQRERDRHSASSARSNRRRKRSRYQRGGYYSDSERECAVNPRTGHCGKTKHHTESPDLCREREKNFSGHRTCHRVDNPSESEYPIRFTEAAQRHQDDIRAGRVRRFNLFERGHQPWNKGKKTGPHRGHKGGGYLDNLSTATSSTHTSDFTSVSDTTSYTMTGGDSYTSFDDTSVSY